MFVFDICAAFFTEKQPEELVLINVVGAVVVIGPLAGTSIAQDQLRRNYFCLITVILNEFRYTLFELWVLSSNSTLSWHINGG